MRLRALGFRSTRQTQTMASPNISLEDLKKEKALGNEYCLLFLRAVSACLLSACLTLPTSSFADTYVATTTERVQVKSCPIDHCRQLFSLPAGTWVRVLSCELRGPWCRIQCRGRTGWILARNRLIRGGLLPPNAVNPHRHFGEDRIYPWPYSCLQVPDGHSRKHWR